MKIKKRELRRLERRVASLERWVIFTQGELVAAGVVPSKWDDLRLELREDLMGGDQR